MNRSLYIVPFFAVATAAIACSSTTESTATPTDDAGATTDAGTTGDGGTSALSFTPSNLDLSGIDLSKVGDFVVTSANCAILSTSKQVGCGDDSALAFGIVDQPNGGGKIGVYVARTISVQPNGSLVADPGGAYPVALVALDTMDVQGVIDVSARSDYKSAGGYQAPTTSSTKGGGPGGGTAGSDVSTMGYGGAGAGYCGLGGKGGATNGTPTAGGVSYGSAQLIPLVGGSSGGNGDLPFAGTGGGAIQLVAGTKFTLGANATIAANGGGGVNGGTVNQNASGGGSGGAILIEAPAAILLGTLVANGGAGGSKATGQDGKLDGTQAMGDTNTNGAIGGAGNASADPNGVAATWVTGDPAGGGGGAGGRIRVNSTTGNGSLSAKVISPSANTPCTTEGTLAAK